MSIAPKLRWSGRPSSTSVAQQDHAGARAEHGQPVVEALGDRSNSPLVVEQLRHRRALAARQHERVDPVEVGRACAPDGVDDAELLRVAAVRGERALQGEHADDVGAWRLRGGSGVTSPGRRSAR